MCSCKMYETFGRTYQIWSMLKSMINQNVLFLFDIYFTGKPILNTMLWLTQVLDVKRVRLLIKRVCYKEILCNYIITIVMFCKFSEIIVVRDYGN